MNRPAVLTAGREPLAARTHGLRLWQVAAVLAAIAGWAYVFLAGDGGWLDLRDRRERLAQLEAEVASLAAQNDSLRAILSRLENDPAYLEKVAREKYGMVRPGERVYRLRTATDE